MPVSLDCPELILDRGEYRVLKSSLIGLLMRRKESKSKQSKLTLSIPHMQRLVACVLLILHLAVSCKFSIIKMAELRLKTFHGGNKMAAGLFCVVSPKVRTV